MTVRKAIALILLLAIMAAGGYYLLKTEQEDNERMRGLYTEVEPLERERETLQQQKKEIEVDYAVKMRDYGTVEILFQTLDAQIYTDVWPVMRSRDVVGVLPLSFSEMPGKYTKLTAEQCKLLMADGWGTCLLYDSSWGGFGYWYEQFARYLDQMEIPVPTAIYFINDDYDSTMDEEMLACGIQTVILNAKDGRSNTVTDVTGGLWFTGAMPWGYTGSAADLELLGRTDGANLVLIMSLNEIWDASKNKNVQSQEKAAFTETLDSWKDYLYTEDPLQDLETVGPTPYIYVDTTDPEVLHEMYLSSLTTEQQLLLPKFRSTNLESAYAAHAEVAANAPALEAQRDRDLEGLDSQIAELEKKIRETYDYYGVGRKEEVAEQSA